MHWICIYIQLIKRKGHFITIPNSEMHLRDFLQVISAGIL